MIDLNSPADGFEFEGANISVVVCCVRMATITDKAVRQRASLKQGSIAS